MGKPESGYRDKKGHGRGWGGGVEDDEMESGWRQKMIRDGGSGGRLETEEEARLKDSEADEEAR